MIIIVVVVENNDRMSVVIRNCVDPLQQRGKYEVA